MAATRPGSFNIFCRACLENPCLVDEGSKMGIVDALIFTSRVVDHSSMVVCSLRFCVGECALREGIYDIFANVRSIFVYQLTLLITFCFKVVAYRQNWIADQPANTNDNIRLMGDIVNIQLFSAVFSILFSHARYLSSSSLSLCSQKILLMLAKYL